MTTLFSQNRIIEYLSEHTIPECLAQKNIEEHSKTLQALLSYCDTTVLPFLEKNRLNENVYTLEGPAFEALLQQFVIYYKKMMVAKKIKTSGLELLRVEQTIHFLTGLSETQNVSIYLYLLPEIYDDENIHELILLLSKKYDKWDDQFADQYIKWICFLAPFSEYINAIGYDYRKVLSLKDTKPDEIIVKHFRSLKERMNKRNIDIGLREEDLGNLKQLQAKLQNLKEVFKGSKINKDNDFYYELGITSFLVHIINAIANGDYTFFKICIHTSVCLSNMNIPIEIKASDETVISNVRKPTANLKDWKEILQKMLSTIQQEPACLFNKSSSPLQVVDSLLFLMSQAKLTDSANFLEASDNSESLLSSLFDSIHIIKSLVEKSESPYYGKYLNYYEYFMMLLLQVAYKIREELALTNLELEKQLCTILTKHIPHIIQTKNLRIVVKELCYQGLQILGQSSWMNKVTKNWNFSENSLSDLILLSDPNGSDDLYLNLKYTLKFYKMLSGDKILQDKASSQDVLDAIYLYIAKIQGDIETWEMPRVKCIGFFFVGLLSIKLPDNLESRFLYLSSFLEFITSRCSLDIYDLSNLQRVLWDALESTENSQQIMLERCMSSLLQTFEDRMAKERITTSTLSPGGELLRIKEVKENIYKMITSSLENTKKNLTAVFFECYPSALEKSMVRLTTYCRKLVYFILKWAENFIKTLDPEKSDDDWTKMVAIFQNITLLYFDPVLILFTEPRERKIMRDTCARIFLHCQYSIGATLQTLYETLRAHLKTMNKELFSNSMNKKNLFQSIRRFKSDTSSSTGVQGYRLISEDFSYQSVCFCSTVLGLYELTDTLNKLKLQPNKHNLEKNVLKKYKSALEAFSELILNMISLAESSDTLKDNETNAELIQKLAIGIQCTIKPLDSVEYSDKVTAHFACNLLSSFLTTNQSPLFETILCMITQVIGGLDQDAVKTEGKKLICATQIWSFIMKKIQDVSTKQIHRYSIDDFVLLVNCLKSNFIELPFDIPMQDIVSPYQLESTRERFTERLFDEIVHLLQSYPIIKMLSRYNDKFGEILKPILFLFERSFYNIRKQCDDNILNVSNKLRNVEEDFAKYKKEKEMIVPSKDKIPNNEFGIMGITVKVAGNRKKSGNKNFQSTTTAKKTEEKVDPKEIAFENQILEVNQTLEVFKQSMNILEDKFFSTLDLVILVYPFSKIEEFYKTRICAIREESSSALLNSFERLCSRIIANSSTQEPSEKSSFEKYFNEIKTSENETYNEFLDFQVYLQLLKELLVQSRNEVPILSEFMMKLFNAATNLLNKLISHCSAEWVKQDDFCAKFENFSYNVSKLLLTYSISQHSQGKHTEDHLKVLNEWLRTIFEVDKYAEKTFNKSLLSQGSGLFKDIVSLLQFGSSFETNTGTLLNQENSVLRTLLCKENNTHWDMSTVSSIAFVVDNLLRGSISDEIAIEMIIKRALLQNPHADLSELIEQITVVAENISTDTLISVLKTNFKLSVDSQDKDRKLYVSIDQTREKESPKQEIERIINSLSNNAKRLLDLLTNSLINNFISNLSQISETKNQHVTKYRETSSIMTMISLLGHKYPQLMIYLAFKKNDYSSLVTPKSLNQFNLEELRSVTFLECLFKTKYFIFHSQDMFLLSKIVGTGLGVTFINPKDPELVLDVGYLILQDFIQLMVQDLENRYKLINNNALESIENYLSLNASVNLFVYLWTQVQKNYEKILFENYFKNQFLLLLTKIVQSIKWIPEYFYKNLKSCENIQNLLSTFLHDYYEAQIAPLSITEDMFNQAKQQNYKEFINCLDSVSELENENMFEKLLKNIEIQEISSSKEAANHLKDNRREGKGVTSFKAPLNVNSTVSFKQTWYETLSQTISDIQEIIPSKGDVKTDNEESQVLQNLRKYLECTRLDLGKEDQYRSSSPDLLIVRCTPLFDVNLASQSNPSISETKLSRMLHEKLSKEENLLEKQSDSKTQSQESRTHVTGNINSEKVNIKYFFHPTIEDQADFQSLERQILIKLKIMSEEISVILFNLSSQGSREDIITKELTEYQRSLSEFERNTLFCHVSQFEVLKSFKCPQDLQEIKAEFTWLKENFSDYISILDRMKGHKNKSHANKSPQKAGTSDSEPLNANEYKLCEEYLKLSNKGAKSELTKTISQNIALFRELYPINDDLVQSLTSFFYIKYEKDLGSSNPATLQLMEELCNSVDFEVKLLDFCMFFLHCPDHLELISGNKAAYRYPYSTILNIEKAQLTFNQVYNVGAFNILTFLKKHLSKHDYLIYQSRSYLEKYGLQTLNELKSKANYKLKTANMVSICDLLVGLQVIPQLAQNTQLSREANSIIFKVFSKERNFKIVEARDNDELFEETSLLSAKSCNTLLKINKIELILRHIPNIMFYSFKEVTHIIENLLEILYQPAKEISLALKSKPKNEAAKDAQVSKIRQLGDLQSVIDIIAEIFSSVSSSLSSKLSKDSNYKEGKEDIQSEAIKILSRTILHKKSIRSLIKQLFGIINCLPNLEATLCSTPLTQALAKICLNFYALICIEQDFRRSKLYLTEEVTSSQTLENTPYKHFKTLQHRLSSQKYRGIAFGVHIVKMCRDYRNLIMTLLGESAKENAQGNGISIIWRHHPKLFDLMTKKKFLMDRISPSVLGARVIHIDRKDLIRTTLQEFSDKRLFILRQGIQVMFEGESGFDAGGLTREFLTIINRDMFNPNKGLFQFVENTANIQPSPISLITPSHIRYFELAGIILAKAIQEECVVDINLTKPLLNHILKRNVTLDDLADIDPDLAKSLKWTLSHSVEGLEQSFTYETRIFGQNITRDLIPNGHKVQVTDENKAYFVRRICQVKMQEEINEQLTAFVRGFHMMIPAEYLSLFSGSELQALIAGDPEIDAEEILKHATFTGYESDPDALIWLMGVLQELTQEQLTAFVFFVTGSLKLPSRNLTEWTIKFKKGGHGANKLPVAHTCSWLIEIPHYTSREELKQKLVQAIFEGQGSFMRH